MALTCVHCHGALDGAMRSCPACGRPVDEPHDLASTSQLPILSRPDLRRFWVIGAVVLALASVATAVRVAVVAHERAIEQRRVEAERRRVDERRAAEHRARVAQLVKAYQGLFALQTAAADGVTFVDYALGLNDAAATLEAYAAPDEAARAVRTHVAAALAHYQLAYKLMGLMVDVGWQAETSRSWFERYRRRHPGFYLGSASTGREALQDCWRSARLEMDAARAGLAAYENGSQYAPDGTGR